MILYGHMKTTTTTSNKETLEGEFTTTATLTTLIHIDRSLATGYAQIFL